MTSAKRTRASVVRIGIGALLAFAAIAAVATQASAHSAFRATVPPPVFELPGTDLNEGDCGDPNSIVQTSAASPAGVSPRLATDPNDPDDVECLPPGPPTIPPAPVPGPLTGKVVAYTSAIDLSLDGNGFRGGIYVESADRSASRKIIQYETYLRSPVAHTFQEPDDHPAISPDGTRIAWTSSRGDPNPGILGVTNWDIWVANINGSNMQRLTTDGDLDTEPIWAPDGSTIYYAHGTDPFFGDGDLDIYKVAADGSGVPTPVVAIPGVDDFEPNVSPDGTKMTFTRDTFGQYEIMIMDLIGGGVTRLTFNDEHDHDSDFSAGGGRIFITSEEGNIKQPYGDVYEINSSTGAVEDRVTNNLLSRGDPSVSADGLAIATMQPLGPITRAPHVIDIIDGNGTNLGFVGGAGIVDIHPNIGVRADSNANGIPDYLESGSVGEPILELPNRVKAGRRFTATFAWEHPEAWRQLDAIELLLTFRGQPVAAVRLLINTLQLSAWENGLGGYGLSREPGAKGVLRSGALQLDLRRSKVINTSTETITARLALSVTKQLAGRGYGISVQADSEDGDHQGEILAGERIRVKRG